MDYLGNGNGNLGRMIGEGGISLGGGAARRQLATGQTGVTEILNDPSAASQAWKREDWNLIRVRVEGVAPKVTVWINDQLVNEQQDSENHAPTAWSRDRSRSRFMAERIVGCPAGFWRWRNIGIRELPN